MLPARGSLRRSGHRMNGMAKSALNSRSASRREMNLRCMDGYSTSPVATREVVVSVANAYETDHVQPALGDHEVPVGSGHHVAHHSSAARNLPALEDVSLRIEAHEGVRFGGGLDVPDRALRVRDRIGLRLRPTRRRPFRGSAGFRIESTEVSARVIRV